MKKLILIFALCISSIANAYNDFLPHQARDFWSFENISFQKNGSRSNSSDNYWNCTSSIVNCFDESLIGESAWIMTSDGETQLKVTLSYTGDDNRYTISNHTVQFYWYDGNDLFNDDSKEVITDTDRFVGTYTSSDTENDASVTITAPSLFPYTSCAYYSFYVVIKVKFKNGGVASVAKNIGVSRPGVLILHGLNDSSDSFKPLKNYLVNSGAFIDSQILTKDYSASNTSSFYANTHENQVVRLGLGELSNSLFYAGIASTKYDMVGHSMGGILERLYIQEVDNEHTNKLITLNTPHFGAPLGNVAPALFYYLDHLPPNIISIFTNKFFNPSGGRKAVSDLAIGSNAIKNLNSNADRLYNIPVFAVGTCIDLNILPSEDVNTYPGYMTEESAFLLAHLFYNVVPRDKYNFLFADNVLGDGVVSIESQLGGLPSKYFSLFSGKPGIPFTSIGGAHHMCSPNWEFTLEEIRLLLLSDPDSNNFSMNGFGSYNNNVSNRIYSRSSSDYVTNFTEPDPESFIKITADLDLNNDSICHTSIAYSSDIMTTMVFSFLSSDKLIASYDTTEAFLNLTEKCDSITLYAIGRTTNNSLLVDSITVNKNDSGVREIVNNQDEFRCYKQGDSMYINLTDSSSSVEFYNVAGQLLRSYNHNEDNLYSIEGLHGIIIAHIRGNKANKSLKIIN